MNTLKRALSYFVLLILLAFPVIIYFNAEALSDWWSLRGYAPPASVTALTAQDSMTSYSKHIFYVNHPNIESNVSQFRNDCNEDEKTIILGCYHSNQAGIFIYNVQDGRLAGVQQVTSAHEMLHAAYDRLSSKDKSRVNQMLEDFFNNGLHDQRIIDTINAYRQSEPKDVVNEMHSVFGTEIANLPADLENYYKKYFTNRHAVTSYANSYQGEFTSREDKIKADDVQLSQMKSQINREESALQVQLDQINIDRARLDSLRSSGQTQQYNAGVPGFNREVSTYNSGVEKLRGDIAAYNQLVTARNSIATELASLSKSIDTRLTPQTTQ